MQARGTQGVQPKVYESLSKVYLPELMERASAGEALEASRAFSFVMVYNNKNVGGIFGCNVIFLWPKKAPLILQIPYI